MPSAVPHPVGTNTHTTVERKAHNPNGSANGIAGVRNAGGNVVGLMPHPEHAVDPDVGPTGGQPLFASLLTQALAGA